MYPPQRVLSGEYYLQWGRGADLAGPPVALGPWRLRGDPFGILWVAPCSGRDAAAKLPLPLAPCTGRGGDQLTHGLLESGPPDHQATHPPCPANPHQTHQHSSPPCTLRLTPHDSIIHRTTHTPHPPHTQHAHILCSCPTPSMGRPCLAPTTASSSSAPPRTSTARRGCW